MPYVLELTRTAVRRRAQERSDRVRLLVAVRRAALDSATGQPDDVPPDVVDDPAVTGVEPARRRVT